jgi:hypothetical protein
MKCGGTPLGTGVSEHAVVQDLELEEVPMEIVGALVAHRRQITYARRDKSRFSRLSKSVKRERFADLLAHNVHSNRGPLHYEL